jgi:hypothetical protein
VALECLDNRAQLVDLRHDEAVLLDLRGGRFVTLRNELLGFRDQAVDDVVERPEIGGRQSRGLTLGNLLKRYDEPAEMPPERALPPLWKHAVTHFGGGDV